MNYLVYVLNKDTNNKFKYVQRYTVYEPITKKHNYNHITMANKYVYASGYDKQQLTYEHFKNNKTIVIKSSTGTGKITAIAQHTETYLNDNKHLWFLTITTRKTLSDQHCHSFQNLQIQNYQSVSNLYNEKCLTLCLNSLDKLSNLDEDEMSNYIIYIDEVASFVELTHNTTLDNNIKQIFTCLMKCIKHAHKVIVSDALINDNVFELLKNRLTDNVIY